MSIAATEEQKALIEWARDAGVKSLSLKQGELAVEFFESAKRAPKPSDELMKKAAGRVSSMTDDELLFGPVKAPETPAQASDPEELT